MNSSNNYIQFQIKSITFKCDFKEEPLINVNLEKKLSFKKSVGIKKVNLKDVQI